MDEIVGQLGGLLLGSVPTIIFVILLFAIYTAVVHKPLTKVLAERHSRTEGAIEKARADIAQAEARTADYEQRLREARMAVFKSQEARRQQALQARAAIEQDKVVAKTGLEAESGRLATAIIRTVLEPATQSPAGGD